MDVAGGVFNLGVKLDPTKAKAGAAALERALRKMGKEGDKAGDNMAKGAKKGAKGYDATEKSARRLKSTLLGLGVSAAALMVTKSILSIGAGFEQSMAEVGGIMNATEGEFKQLSAVAKEMGENTEWSASQAASGLKYLGMAGFTATQAVRALPGVLNLATASGIDLGRASDIASNALTAMGLEVSELTRVNDVFIRTITGSNVNMEQMAEAFKYAAPTAKGLGYSIEELSAMIGMLGNAGLQGSIAGTNLNRAFLQTGKVFDHYGVSMQRADGSTKDFIDAITLLRDRGASTNEIMAIFGTVGGKAAMIMKDNLPTYEKLLKRMYDVDVTANKLAETMRNTVGGAWKELKSVVESVAISIFEENKADIKQFLKDLGQSVRDNKDDIVTFFDGMSKLLLKIAQSAPSALTGVTDFFNGVISAWNAIPTSLQDMIIGAAAGSLVAGPIGAAGGGAFGLGYGMMDQMHEGAKQRQAELAKVIELKDRERAEMKVLQESMNGDHPPLQILSDKELAFLNKKGTKGGIIREDGTFENYGHKEKPIKTQGGPDVDPAPTKAELARIEAEKARLLRLEEDFYMEKARVSADAFAAQWLQYERDQEKFRELVSQKKITQADYDQWSADEQARISEEEKEHYQDRADNLAESLQRKAQAEALAYRQSLEASDDWADGLKLALEDLEEANLSTAQQVADVWADASQAMGSAFSELMYDSITGDLVSLQDVVDSFTRSITRSITNSIGQSISNDMMSWGAEAASGEGGLFSSMMGMFSSAPAKALGGSVYKQTAYMVGERGPELFVPDGDGMVVPNHKLSAGTQGQVQQGSPKTEQTVTNNSTSVQMTVVTPDADSFRRSEGQVMSRMNAAISRAARRNS